jgi:DNA-directed RNA polymerase subunit N (RpoN/RPB10)
MELPVKPEILTLYIHKLSCGTVVCKHFASYQVTLITDGI